MPRVPLVPPTPHVRGDSTTHHEARLVSVVGSGSVHQQWVREEDIARIAGEFGNLKRHSVRAFRALHEPSNPFFGVAGTEQTVDVWNGPQKLTKLGTSGCERRRVPLEPTMH